VGIGPNDSWLPEALLILFGLADRRPTAKTTRIDIVIHAKLAELQSIREERFTLMERLADLPKDMVFFTQITMEAAEDTEFLEAMRRARIKGALVGCRSRDAPRPESCLQGF